MASGFTDSKSSSQRYVLGFSLIALLIFAAAQLSLSILQLKIEASPIWLPTGIALAALMGRGIKFWPAVAIALLIFNKSAGASDGLAIGSAIGNTIQAVIGTKLLKRCRVAPTLNRVRDVLMFVGIGVLLTPCVNATISTATADWTNLPLPNGLGYNWWTLWLGDSMGILTLTPLLLRWQNNWQNNWQPSFKQAVPTPRRSRSVHQILEQGLCFLLLVGLSSLIFYTQIDRNVTEYPLEYLPFPFVIWAALRFGQSRAIWASVLLSAIAISGTIFNLGPFVVKGEVLRQQVLLLQAFIAVIVITGLIVAAIATERNRSELELRQIVERDRLLQEMTLSIRQSLDLDTILNTTVNEIRHVLGCDRVFFARFDPDGKGEMVAESVLPGWRSTLGARTDSAIYDVICAAFSSGTRVADNLSQMEQRPFFERFHRQFAVQASIGIPIIEAERITGLLAVHQCDSVRHWQRWEVELLERLATPIAIAIQQGELYQRVQHLNSNLEQQVTDRTKALQHSLQEQEAMSQIQDVLFHAIAHDLRTTLIGTMLILESLQSQSGEAVTLKRSILNRMVQSSDSQITKLNRLLEVYQNRTEGLVIYPEPYAIEDLVRSVVDHLAPLFEENQTILSIQAPSDLSLVAIDIAQMQRVLMQILTNAVKHNPPKTEVTIKLDVLPNISPESSSLLRIAIADNGKGISAVECDRLFDLRLHGSPDEKQLTGIHIGLYLCDQIMTAHRGKITVDSILDQGSTFWLTLPLTLPIAPPP
jgi:signal transduction histidine kinase/integral membrane sensor domain MASE1